MLDLLPASVGAGVIGRRLVSEHTVTGTGSAFNLPKFWQVDVSLVPSHGGRGGKST